MRLPVDWAQSPQNCVYFPSLIVQNIRSLPILGMFCKQKTILMNSESLRFFFYLIWFCLSPLITVGLPGTEAAAAGIQLKNGVTLKGEVARIGTLVVDPNASNTEDGGSILLIDDDLRRIYVPVNQIREVTPNIGQDEISFEMLYWAVSCNANSRKDRSILGPTVALGALKILDKQ